MLFNISVQKVLCTFHRLLMSCDSRLTLTDWNTNTKWGLQQWSLLNSRKWKISMKLVKSSGGRDVHCICICFKFYVMRNSGMFNVNVRLCETCTSCRVEGQKCWWSSDLQYWEAQTPTSAPTHCSSKGYFMRSSLAQWEPAKTRTIEIFAL